MRIITSLPSDPADTLRCGQRGKFPRRLGPDATLGMLVEEFLGLVDLGGQVRATATIGVVEEHELTVLLADLVLVEGTLAVELIRRVSRASY